MDTNRADIDELLDEALAGDPNGPVEYDDDADSEALTEGDLVADGEDYDEEGDDTEYDAAPAGGLPDGAMQQLLAQNQQLQAALQQQAAMAQQARQVQVLEQLVAAKDNMTADEWANFQAQLAAGYAMYQKQRADSIEQGIYMSQFQAAEADAREQCIQVVADKLNANRTELAALRACQTPVQMKATIDELKQARAERTQAARSALREQRTASGVDRSGARGTGGGNPAPPQFASLDDLVNSIFG